MSQKLTDAVVRSLAVPATGNVVAYDGGHRDAVAGFGCRVTASGKRAFILNYRTRSGRERRYTIGQFPDWTTSAARDHAGDLKAKIRGGYDPLAELEGDREAKTIADLCDRFEEEFLPKKRPATQRDYGTIIRKWIRPDLRHKKVAELEFSDIDALHRKVTKSGATYNANRTVAVLSKMLTLAVQWHWRADNPARGIERNHEEKRQRYLSTAELARLIAALNGHADQEAANIVRLLLLTGARRGEVWPRVGTSSTCRPVCGQSPVAPPSRRPRTGSRYRHPRGCSWWRYTTTR
ncbi:MAG: integrase family protein [Hyphomicrobium sp.]